MIGMIGIIGCKTGGSGASSVAPSEVRGDVPEGRPPQAVVDMVAEIDGERMHALVTALAGFGTRHTLSRTHDPKRGIGAAREFLHRELQQAGSRLQVRFDPHAVQPDGRRIPQAVDVVNVVATLPGSMPSAAARHYYVVGHYDSRASDPLDAKSDAPGANDDASGVAVVTELARVMASRSFDATIVFMATAAEEQGLIGADRHARAARQAGIDIRGVLSNDIVGDPTAPSGAKHDAEVRVFSASLDAWLLDEDLERVRTLSATNDSPSRQLARFVDTVARWHALPVQAKLVFRHDRFLRGGDHTAFNASGYPAVRFCEVEENYARQHQDVRTEGEVQFGDLPEHVDATYLAGVARINAAALAHLANAPSTPTGARIVTAELTNDTTLRWDASPEPDVAGYEVVWRDTTSPQWEHTEDVGEVTEATLPLSKDNVFFGVRAYDGDGYRSPVAFPIAARE
jgi:Zn-dependent M28 family amino/carboxypeptidase